MGLSEEKEDTLKAFKSHFAREVGNGLSKNPKELYSKYIYDDQGSALFEQIMELEEYYPTRCEKAVFEKYKNALAGYITDKPVNLVELGAGNGEKTTILLKHFLEYGKNFSFWPLDISDLAINNLKSKLRDELPGLDFQGMVADYFEGLKAIKKQNDAKNLVLFLGSNIGNFPPQERDQFISDLKQSLKPGDLVFMGFDLKKDPRTINKAYNDKDGVTEAFNFNLLNRINRELGGNFDPANFRFYAAYNALNGAVEACLISRKKQTVYIAALGETFTFDAWEPIHTESSFKFSRKEIQDMANRHGFREKSVFSDEADYYANALWER